MSAAGVILLGVENSRPGGQLMSPGPQQQMRFWSSSSGQLSWWGLRHDKVLWSLGCPSFPEATKSWNKGCASLISESLSCGHLGSQRNKRLCSQSEGENPITHKYLEMTEACGRSSGTMISQFQVTIPHLRGCKDVMEPSSHSWVFKTRNSDVHGDPAEWV